MRVLIYGGGAVGLGLGSCLIKGGASVELVARAATVAALKRGGLVRRGIFGRFRAAPELFGAYESLAEIAAGASAAPGSESPSQGYDYVLVCVKSFDSAAAAEDLARHQGLLAPAGRIVLCQNGWGNAEEFCRCFPPERVYSARVITGFSHPAPHEVAVTVHADAIHVGSLFGEPAACVRDLCRAVAAGDIPCATTDQIGKDLWAKMLYNCALNPLGAILRVPYGRLGQSPASRYLMERIVEEVYQVMTASSWQTHWPGPAGFLEAFYGQQLPATAAHESSMLQDILARRRTEIDALNGQVVVLAGRRALEVPFNRTVCELIRFQEQEYLVNGGGDG